MKTSSVTRGYGPLEQFLANQRCKIANKYIPKASRSGRILDIGCGNYPLFLMNTDFKEKYGLEKILQRDSIINHNNQRIFIKNYDLEKQSIFPFMDNYFNVITMLAVFEHIELKILVNVISEVHRALIENGLFIMTTPAGWTDRLLKLMAKLRLVSPIEIEEHKDSYYPSKIRSILENGDFERDRIKHGYFELFTNIWVTARK